MELQGFKIDLISDTHNSHEKIGLPGGDLLIHAGDATMAGKVPEMMKFLAWYARQDYKYKIFVPGNHDWVCESEPSLIARECADRGIVLLNDSGVVVEGINIWGSAVQPWFHDWAFNRQRGADIRKHWDLIPEDTEILVTHGPPYQILDQIYERHGRLNKNKDTIEEKNIQTSVGCQDLFLKILQTKIKLHVFGHIHETGGYKYWDQRTFVNASALDGQYVFRSPGYIHVIKQENDYFVENPDHQLTPEEQS